MAAKKKAPDTPVGCLCRTLLGNKGRSIVWFLITISTTELTLLSNGFADQPDPEKTIQGLTCNLDGIPSEERARYTELFESLRHAVREKRELQDGYALLLDPASI